MKQLRMRKRESAGTDTDAAPAATASAARAALVPSPPPVNGKPPGSNPSDGADAPAPAAAAAVKFSSELDNAAVEAYLEYLTRPHNSWGSATRHLALRREVIEEHRNSVFARSLASSRHASFASSTARSEGGGGDGFDAMGGSVASSVASAPAGFPRAALNSSKSATGMLRKGRLAEAGPSPSPFEGTVESLRFFNRTASSDASALTAPGSRSSVVSGAGQHAAANRGRLSRGPALAAAPRSRGQTSPSTTSATSGMASTAPGRLTAGRTPGGAGGPALSVGGRQLQTAGVNSFVISGQASAAAGRTASRDGADAAGTLAVVAPSRGGGGSGGAQGLAPLGELKGRAGVLRRAPAPRPTK